jgi:hypothetical protein
MTDLVAVLLIGHSDKEAEEKLLLTSSFSYEADSFRVTVRESDSGIESID